MLLNRDRLPTVRYANEPQTLELLGFGVLSHQPTKRNLTYECAPTGLS
jgi:hypothetical protein